MVEVAEIETLKEHESIIHSVHEAIGKSPQAKKWPITINWKGFTKTPEFTAYHPEAQCKLILFVFLYSSFFLFSELLSF